MKSVTLNSPGLFIKAVGISLVLHFLIIIFLTFTFPQERWHAQPIFTFLGSILRADDLQSTSVHSRAVTRISTDNLNWTPRASLNVIPLDKIVTKPIYNSNIKGREKIFLKSTFAIQKSSPKKNKEADNILGIDTATPAYHPLRLYQNDQN